MVVVNVKARYSVQFIGNIFNLYSSSCVDLYKTEITFFENCDVAIWFDCGNWLPILSFQPPPPPHTHTHTHTHTHKTPTVTIIHNYTGEL